jgi:hypothetical protein
VDTTAPKLEAAIDNAEVARSTLRTPPRSSATPSRATYVPRIAVDWTNNGIVGSAYLDCEAFSAVKRCA